MYIKTWLNVEVFKPGPSLWVPVTPQGPPTGGRRPILRDQRLPQLRVSGDSCFQRKRRKLGRRFHLVKQLLTQNFTKKHFI